MDVCIIQYEMKSLCRTKNRKDMIGLIDDGYKGMFVILRILQESDGGNVVAGGTCRTHERFNRAYCKGFEYVGE